MKISIFASFPYSNSDGIPTPWPVPPGFCDAALAPRSFQESIDLLKLADDVGFDWISVSEHHYTNGTLSGSPVLLASALIPALRNAKIAMLGHTMPLNNPVRVAEELAMLDNLSDGRLIVGLLRGTPENFLVYGVNPVETRERTLEGMELVLKAWTEPQPFSWEGRYYQYRTVSVWPRPRQQPFPPMYVLGNSADSCEFAARHRLGIGVSFGPFEVNARSTEYYRECCAREGWTPAPEQIIYRGSIHIGETDAEVDADLQSPPDAARRGGFPMKPTVQAAVAGVDPNPFHTGGAPIPGREELSQRPLGLGFSFRGSPDTVVEQVKRCREITGAGVVDFFFSGPGMNHERRRRAVELVGKAVIPRVRDL